MSRRCETFEHTADIGLRAWADTLAELYQALAECLAEQVCPRESVQPREERRLAVSAEDREALAVDFLSRLVAVMQGELLLVRDVEVCMAGAAGLEATLRGERYDPARHELGEEIKAVTYHLLQVRQEGDGWTGRVVLDV